MKHLHHPHLKRRIGICITLLGSCVLYVLFIPPSTQLRQIGFVLLSTLTITTLLWHIQHRLIVIGITVGMYELMTITLGFDILNTIVLVSTGLVIYLYTMLEQSNRHK